jgi:hypothetical protein
LPGGSWRRGGSRRSGGSRFLSLGRHPTWYESGENIKVDPMNYF